MNRKNKIILAFVLMASVVAVYLPSLGCGYIWDDDLYPQLAQKFHTLEGLKKIWFEVGVTPQYYPLVWTSYWFENLLFGDNPLVYHVTNIVLHALVSVLVFHALASLNVPGAFVAALIFAIHPIHVESVSWITERKNVLSSLFYLLSFSFFMQSLSFRRRLSSKGLYLLSLLFYLLALLSKTVTCSSPAVLILIMWWKKKKFRLLEEILSLLPFFLMGIGLSLITIWVEQHQSGALGKDWDLSFLERCLIAGRALCFYVSKILWPSQLTFIYPRWEIDTSLWWQYLFPLAVISLIGVLWSLKKYVGKGPLVSLLYFSGTLFPALGFFNVYPMKFSFVADHFQYLASIGMISLFVVLLKRLLIAFGLPKFQNIFFGIVLLIFSFMTWNQQSQYKDREALWKETIKRNPNCWLAYNNLAVIVEARGDRSGALQLYQKSLSLKPDYTISLNNIASILIQGTKTLEARPFLKRALELSHEEKEITSYMGEEFATTQRLWGDMLRVEGKIPEAIERYRYVLSLVPMDLSANVQLGNLLFLLGRNDEALVYCLRAVEIDPNKLEPNNNLGAVYQKKKMYKEAIKYYQRSLKIDPSYVLTHYNLANSYLKIGDLPSARFHFKQVMRYKAGSGIADNAQKKLQSIEKGPPPAPPLSNVNGKW